MQLVFDAIMGQVREYMNSLFSALNVMMNDLQVKKNKTWGRLRLWQRQKEKKE